MPMLAIGAIVLFVLLVSLVSVLGKLVWIGIAVFVAWVGWTWFKTTPTYKKYL